jgi:hypothetical protein
MKQAVTVQTKQLAKESEIKYRNAIVLIKYIIV